jgi:uncharacterized protein YyaL (SSP411 family)
MSHKFTNQLAGEKSPYLLQHAHNPVDWHPWGEAVFAKARAEGKPIFLSIGYSTCHWCHVMERESFEVEAVGRFLNEHFVSIKVDREERPDVDKIYMTFVQATTGSGGWPMNVFLTPDLKPFYGGTYFPPEPRYGRPSFLQLLERINELWQTRRTDLETNAVQVQQQLAAAMETHLAPDATLNPEWLRAAGATFMGMYDPQNGGFGRAPKFPQPSQPQFLLRYAHRYGDETARRMVLHTCERMAAGGIHDQLGGGFARYSVDAEWRVPHFEKMLYDNAQLVPLYLDAYLVSGDTRHADTARDILDYVLRDMTAPGGGFYSAEDADSEGHEGKFYCWTHAELSNLLTVEEFNVAVRYFGVTKQGNFVDHSHPTPLGGQNVLSAVAPDLSKDDAVLLASGRAKMIAARAKRVRPHRDDKVLSSWNGLMLGAFARAGVVLNEEKYRTAAEMNLKFIQDRLWDDLSKTLYHRWRDGEHDSVQLLDAYAFQLSGVLELYEATLEPRHLDFAIALADAMLDRFYDSKDGGFWQSSPGSIDLILRLKDDQDGAEPAGSSVATLALLKLAAVSDRKDYYDAAEKTLRAAATKVQHGPQAVPYLLMAMDYWSEHPRRVVIAGDPTRPACRELLQAAHSVYQPGKVVLGNQGAVDTFARTLPAAGDATVYICVGEACQPPTDHSAEVRNRLAN